MLALGVRPDTVYDEPVHALGERAFDSADPTKEYVFAKSASDLAAGDTVYIDPDGLVAAAGAAGQVNGIIETDLDGSVDPVYGWVLVRGIASGLSGLTSGLAYLRAQVASALVADPSGDLGFAVSTTALYLAG